MVKNQKNVVVSEMIERLDTQSRESKVPLWGALAKGLNRPKRKEYKVNLHKLESNVRKKDKIIAVPGTVLGSGELTKPLKVAAWKFSAGAEEKIKKAGGKCLTIEDLMKDNPKGHGVRIMG